RSAMGINVNHVPIKTKDPVATAKYYVDNFGARIKQEIPVRGLQVDLHGLQLTTLIKEQNHEQHYGIEHIALAVDDYPGTLSKLKANGVEILRELPPNNGRRVCFLAATDGSQIELIEKV